LGPTSIFFAVTRFSERERAQSIHNQAGFGSQNGEIKLGTQGFDGRERKCISSTIFTQLKPAFFLRHRIFSLLLFLFSTEPQEFNPDTSDTAALINQGKNIQAQSAASLDRSLKQVPTLPSPPHPFLKRVVCSLQDQVLATEQLGTETAVKLKQQTDQLVNIHKNVDTIESDLQRADKIVLLSTFSSVP
jgi:hypothetical protein